MEENKIVKVEMNENAQAIARAAIERLKTGEIALAEASKQMAHAAVTAKIFDPENKKFISKVSGEKEEELKQDFQGKRILAEAEKLKAKATKAEAFYINWRPVLEFDFSHLLRNKEPKQIEYKERAYGIPLMVLMLVLLTPIYCLVTIILSVINGINAICARIGETVKIARIITYGVLLIFIAFCLVLLVTYIAQSYFSIQIF